MLCVRRTHSERQETSEEYQPTCGIRHRDPFGLLPQATQVPIPAYVQPCSPAQSSVNPTKLAAQVKESFVCRLSYPAKSWCCHRPSPHRGSATPQDATRAPPSSRRGAAHPSASQGVSRAPHVLEVLLARSRSSPAHSRPASWSAPAMARALRSHRRRRRDRRLAALRRRRPAALPRALGRRLRPRSPAPSPRLLRPTFAQGAAAGATPQSR